MFRLVFALAAVGLFCGGGPVSASLQYAQYRPTLVIHRLVHPATP